MTEKFNFSKNITAIVAPELRALGFKRKGPSFTKPCDGSALTIHFQRSSWNLPGLPFQMYINIGFKIGEGSDRMIGRLDRPTDYPFPAHYQPFFDSTEDNFDWEARSRLMESFSDQQQWEIERWIESARWEYSDEEELRERLREAKAFFSEVYEELIEEIRSAIANDQNGVAHSRDPVERVYWNHLPPESRWIVRE